MRVKTGGQLFIRLLQERGVHFVFGTTGAGMPELQDAMVVEKPPKWIQGLHEFPSVSAATGYALATETAGVVLIDRIVGTQNAIGAMYAAYLNSAPVVVLASTNHPSPPTYGREVPHHYYSLQAALVAPWVKWWTESASLESVERDLDKAVHSALSEHQGPSYLMLREELMAQDCTVRPGKPRRNAEASYRIPDDPTLLRVLKLVLEADSPWVITSQLGRHPRAVRSLVRVAHLLGLAVRERRVFMNYPVTDPLHLGFSHPLLGPEFPPEADLALALEIGVLPSQDFDPRVDVVDLSSDPLHRQDVSGGGDYGSTLFDSKVSAVCDIGPTLDRLAGLAESKMLPEARVIGERHSKIEEQHEAMLSTWRATAERSYKSGRLDSWSVGYILNKHWPEGATWVDGTMSEREGLLKSIELAVPGTYYSNPSGHLGPAAGMAYGVALAGRLYGRVEDRGSYKVGEISKSKRVTVCTVGDGDAVFGNIDSSLWTCSHYGIGVLYVVMNNACWGVEWPPFLRTGQRWAEKAGDFECVDLDKPRISFERIASAFRVESARATTTEELEEAIPRLLRTVRKDRPALVDVQLGKPTGKRASVVR